MWAFQRDLSRKYNPWQKALLWVAEAIGLPLVITQSNTEFQGWAKQRENIESKTLVSDINLLLRESIDSEVLLKKCLDGLKEKGGTSPLELRSIFEKNANSAHPDQSLRATIMMTCDATAKLTHSIKQIQEKLKSLENVDINAYFSLTDPNGSYTRSFNREAASIRTSLLTEATNYLMEIPDERVAARAHRILSTDHSLV